MAAQPKQRWTVEAYLEHERTSAVRHEYFAGEIFAMAGASAAHVDVRSNTQTALMNRLRGRGCKVNDSDMRVKTPTGLYTYPDISVVCGQHEFNEDRPPTLLNPLLIVEVLSTSTEADDRGDKFRHYRSLPTLRAYLLIASERRQIEYWQRTQGDLWRITTLEGETGSITLEEIDCPLSIEEVYEGVAFS